MTIPTPRIGPLAWAALALGALASIVIAYQGSMLVRAILRPSAGVGDVRKAVEEQAQRYAEAFDPHVAQINGRQLFLMPVAPIAEVELPPDDTDDTEPTQPTVYAGPSIVAMINDVVWFSNGARIAKGQKDGDITVVEIDAPWSAQVQWRGSEFTVSLFDRDSTVIPAADRPGARRTPVVPAPELSPAPSKPASTTPGAAEPKPAVAPAASPSTPAPASPATPPPPEEPNPTEVEPPPPPAPDPDPGSGEPQAEPAASAPARQKST